MLFRFRDGVTWSDPRAQEAEKATHGHPREIPEILEWTAGRNSADRENAYDFAVVGLFEDHAALGRYMEHPDHRRGVRLWREISEWVVTDIDLARAAAQ
ncbi:Dabb family protein [Streptomyces specialis]|uniref:Dabb family protein n=1 Tax=Streptomyces specialis TaxID=498367 RepID=UPI001F2DE6D2|nr:Dabb family protein [Streptomyces specialis]